MNYYHFTCSDNQIRIEADSLSEAKDKLSTFLAKCSEELYTLDDYTLCEEAPYYV